ncbi:MAG: hypothetical protein AAF458_20470 [Pseudomonadota bacterium]
MNHDSRIRGERALDHYLRKRLLRARAISASPSPDLTRVVVIPCHDEPEILPTLDALSECASVAPGSTEVLVFINASEAADDAKKRRNETTAATLIEAARSYPLPLHVVLDNTLAKDIAGVGLARKLIMDEALQRLAQAGAPDGVIISLDADCVVSRNYLSAIDGAFARKPGLGAVTVNFEHRMRPEPAGSASADTGLDRSGLGRAATLYELYLRYYRLGLAWAGSTHAFHTVGSCMAVRARDYARVGGMNRRQAGEDFYFLQKFMDIGILETLNETTVYPGVRESTRVPFGTGAAIRDALRAGNGPRFHPRSGFSDLRALFQATDALYDEPERWLALPDDLARWLAGQHFGEALLEIRRNVRNGAAFDKRLRRWMNGFRCMKYLRFTGETLGFESPPEAAVSWLLTELGAVPPAVRDDDLRPLLRACRLLDQQQATAGLNNRARSGAG